MQPLQRWCNTAREADISIQSCAWRAAIHLTITLPLIALCIPKVGMLAAGWYALVFALAVAIALLSYIQEMLSSYHATVTSADGDGGYVPAAAMIVHHLYHRPAEEYDTISIGSRAMSLCFKLVLVAGATALAREIGGWVYAAGIGLGMAIAAGVLIVPFPRSAAPVAIVTAIIASTGMIPLLPGSIARAPEFVAFAIVAALAMSSGVFVRTAPGLSREQGDGDARVAGLAGDVAEVSSDSTALSYEYDKCINGRVYRYLHLSGMRRRARETVGLYTAEEMLKTSSGERRPAPDAIVRGQRRVNTADAQKALDG
jgi:hypothetical protein